MEIPFFTANTTDCSKPSVIVLKDGSLVGINLTQIAREKSLVKSYVCWTVVGGVYIL